MTDIKKSALELIGNTPLLEPENYERKYELTARLFFFFYRKDQRFGAQRTGR